MSAGGVKLADLAGGVQFAAQSHDVMKFDATSAVVFYNAFTVRRSLLTGTTSVRAAKIAADWADLPPIEPAKLRASALPMDPA